MNDEKRRGRPRKEPRVRRSLDLPTAIDAAMTDAATRAGKTPHAFMVEAVAQASGWSVAEPPAAQEPEAPRPVKEKAKPQPKAHQEPERPRGIVSGLSLPAGAKLRDPTRR